MAQNPRMDDTREGGTDVSADQESELQTPTAQLEDRGVHADLSSLQRDIMRVVFQLELEMTDPPVGVTIIETLEADYGFDLDEAAIYDRLNDLSDKGLLNKKLATEDRRKKGYYTTAIGKGIVKMLHNKWSTPVFDPD